MAKKQNNKSSNKSTLQFWAKEFQVKPAVIEAVKGEKNLSNTSRLTKVEFNSIINNWLKGKAGGQHG